jgi:hypothetical protein
MPAATGCKWAAPTISPSEGLARGHIAVARTAAAVMSPTIGAEVNTSASQSFIPSAVRCPRTGMQRAGWQRQRRPTSALRDTRDRDTQRPCRRSSVGCGRTSAVIRGRRTGASTAATAAPARALSRMTFIDRLFRRNPAPEHTPGRDVLTRRFDAIGGRRWGGSVGGPPVRPTGGNAGDRAARRQGGCRAPMRSRSAAPLDLRSPRTRLQ